MANLIYVDNSVTCIEGQHVAAYAYGLAPSLCDAVTNNICDNSWNLDFGKLIARAGGSTTNVAKVALFGRRPPHNDSLWEAARRNGWDVKICDRSAANQEHQIHTDLVVTMIKDSFLALQPGDEMTLVAGGSDYAPAIEKLKARGITVRVVYWTHASLELEQIATKFIELDLYLDHLSR
ncbi:NYN domain-containing protein [Pseudomonas sp. RIT-PI-a]|uniref:NYN domain-containing protein n=1 Tax=Pseudomonas sp. RIT-PI-a TaxID=1681194 RepID=UPI00067602BB|nr:NYN domain-containing protein [Pseudomonas sp. RIT-PI-a]KNC16709.1 hypothetical protein AC788_04060 [Pseudomonas sp. RIT-PI-a]